MLSTTLTKEPSGIIAALKCQAIGDALGDPFQFELEPQAEDLIAYMRDEGELSITDDTQMTLFGFEGVLELLEFGAPDNQVSDAVVRAVRGAYLNWYATQTYAFPEIGFCGLMDFPEMFSRRAPGNICLESLKCLEEGRPVKNNSLGCGTVMRALPFVLFESADVCVKSALLTHQGGDIIPVSLLHHFYLRELLSGRCAWKYKGTELKTHFADGGWQARSCFSIAAWAFENCEGNFEKLMKLAILHPGDSNSTASVAGAMFGLYYKAVPDPLYGRLLQQDAIDYVVSGLKEFVGKSLR